MRSLFVPILVLLLLGCEAPSVLHPSVPDECQAPGRAGSYWCQSLLHPDRWGGWRHPGN